MNQNESRIEFLDAKRMRYMELYILGVAVFVALSITRFFFRLGNLNSQPIGIAVLVGLILSLGLISLSTLQTSIFWKKVKQEPFLMGALNNELIQALALRSWKAAYLGAGGTALFFGVVSIFYPVSDPMLMALTSIIAGAGAFQATFYFLYRTS